MQLLHLKLLLRNREDQAMDIHSEICALVAMHQEGTYWDFKKEFMQFMKERGVG